MNFSINSTAGTADLQIGTNQPLQFPPRSTSSARRARRSPPSYHQRQLGTNFTDTGGFVTRTPNGNVLDQEFQVIPYNNLVYLVRAVSNVTGARVVGGLGTILRAAHRYLRTDDDRQPRARAGRPLQAERPAYFGSTYTPTTMVDTLDTLDFTNITGETFYAPTIFIPIPELDATKGFVANISNFLGEQIWTFIYPEIVAAARRDRKRRRATLTASTSTTTASRSSACRSCTSSTTRWPCCSPPTT